LELRQQILREAFGDRTIHVDLRFRPPLHALGNNFTTSPGHPPLARLPEIPPSPPSADGAWRWFSCLCRRDPPPHSPNYNLLGPPDDGCLSGGGSSYCSLWPGTEPSKCRIGAIGFLLTCRQA
jgi:hypothetical protein